MGRLVWLAPVVLLLAGCGGSSSAPPPGAESRVAQDHLGEGVFRSAINLLDGLDEFESGEALGQVVGRLNQWIASAEPGPDWQPDPLVATLPERLRKLPQVEALGELGFPPADGLELRQALWLRDVSQVASGGAGDDLERATLLFDWTVRNIQLEGEDSGRDGARGSPGPPRVPWQTLLAGRGSAVDRAWVFMLLARQQGLDVVVLADPGQAAGEAGRIRLAALLLEDQLFLFDPQLGLTIPGPEGRGVSTLAQAAADDGLLRHLDLDSEHRYPLTSSDITGVVALVEASPMYLARRMELVEARLAGAERLVLSVAAAPLAERLKACPHVRDARLWTLPFERLGDGAQRELWEAGEEARPLGLPLLVPRKGGANAMPDAVPALGTGRVLHLRGRFSGAQSASYFYQVARLPEADMTRYGAAVEAYVNFLREQGAARGSRAKEAEGWLVPGRPIAQQYVELARVAKANASYWLGLVAFERGKYSMAIDYFGKRTLEASPDGPWTAGARYNLARAYEAADRLDEAIQTYQGDRSPQRHGSLLRARWLAAANP